MDQLKELRESIGFTQAELGRAAGIVRWRIAHAESGLIELTSDEARRVRAAIGKAARANLRRVETVLGQQAVGA